MDVKNRTVESFGTSKHSRRMVIGAGLGLGAGSLLIGPAGRIAAQDAPALPEGAATEQILRIQTGSSGASTFSLAPLGGGGDQQNWLTLLRVSPLYFDVDLNLQPGIFDTWTANEDSTVWTFTIDKRAVWSDGTPVTAADIKGTWELMTDPIIQNGRVASYLGKVVGFADLQALKVKEASGFVVKDDRTLEVQLTSSDSVFNWRIATVHLAPVKVDQARNNPEEFWKPSNNPVSSGPYLLTTFDADQGTATMEKNPNWWLDEGPYLDKIEFKFVTDPGTLSIMVQNGEVDAGMQILPEELKPQFPDWFTPIKAFGFNLFWFSFTSEPTNDINVRKALIQAVNFDDVFAAAFPTGGGAIINQLIDPDFPCTDTKNSWYAYDPEAAKAALAASTYGSVENLPKLRVTPRGVNPVFNRAMESIVEFWRQNLGITNIEFKQQTQEFGQSEQVINVSRDDCVVRMPDTATYLQTAIYSTSLLASGEMMHGYKNAAIDKLIDEALALAADDPQRCELSIQAQHLFMEDYMVMLFGIEDSTLNALGYVKNFLKGPDVSLIEPWKIYLIEH